MIYITGKKNGLNIQNDIINLDKSYLPIIKSFPID